MAKEQSIYSLSKTKYTLRDISDLYFCEKKPEYGNYLRRCELFGEPADDEMESTYPDKMGNFYIERVKEFREIIYALQITDDMEKLKHNDGNYYFGCHGMSFVKNLFYEYGAKGKLEPLLTGRIAVMEYEYRIYLYHSVINIFRENEADEALTNAVAEKLYNHLDIPVCMVQVINNEISKRLSEMVFDKVHTLDINMGILDKFEWLSALSEEYKAFVEKWDDLYGLMREVRSEEASEYAIKKAASMSEEQEEYAAIEFEYSGEINDRLAHNTEYQELEKEYCKMLGIEYIAPILMPENIRNRDITRTRQGKLRKRHHVKKIEKRYNEVVSRKTEIIQEITKEVYQKHIPGYEIPDDEKLDDFVPKESDAVLKEAIQYQNERWEDEKNRKIPKLPDINFGELTERMKNLP